MIEQHEPPMDPETSEATGPQLERAKAQGKAFSQALEYMVQEVADDGGTKRAGEYIVSYAIEEAEGMYHFADGELVWRNPEGENVHVEIAVQDAADGRLVPAATVTATLVTPSGQELGPFAQVLVWHPMLYHYARNWTVPEDGECTLRVHIDPPVFMRHDEVNGRRFAEPVDVEFTGVRIQRGAEPVTPPSQ